MIPRGEVGLIFAGIGATLTLPGETGMPEPVINAATFGTVVIMVVIITLVTPPVLKWAMRRNQNKHTRFESDDDDAAAALRKVAEESAERTRH
jgi:Kef-type K+ transport system membrane component KefB